MIYSFKHIEKYYNHQIVKLDSFFIDLSKKRFWVLRLALIFSLIAFVFSPPKFHHFSKAAVNPPGWGAVDYQMEHFLQPLPFHDSSHMNKRVFRLTIPVLGLVTGIKSGKFWTILQIFLNVLFFYLLLKVTLNITGFSLSTLYFNLGLVGVFFASTCISDTGYRYDGYAFLFILLMLNYKHPLVIFTLTLLASFCDERGFMTGALVFLWWLFQYLFKKTEKITPLIAVVLGMVTYLGLRFFLASQYNLVVPSEDGDGIGLEPLKHNIHYIPLGLLASFEFYWFFPLLGMLFLYIKKQYIPLMLWGGAMGVMTIVAFLVFDITSSLSFTFPSILIGFLILHHYTKFEGMKKYFLFTSIGSLLFPTYWFAITPWYYLPLPFVIIQWILGIFA